MTRIGKIAWLLKRLRVMSIAEVGYRVQQTIDLRRMRRHYQLNKDLQNTESDRPAIESGSVLFLKVPEQPVNRQSLQADAHNLLDGQVHYGGRQWKFSASPATWRWTGNAETLWPDRFFADIDYRPGNPVGDARIGWEPSRLQHLYALSALISEDSPEQSHYIVGQIEAQVSSWVSANPMYHGVHYVSSMECGLRIIALAHTAANLEQHETLSNNLRAQIITLTAEHAHYIRRRISRYSSAGNHTLAECAGLIYAAVLLAPVKDVHDYLDYALELFCVELDHQVLSDGSGIERSSWYHQFNLQLAGLVCSLLQAHDRDVPPLASDALARGRKFLGILVAATDTMPLLGDGDDGYALSRYVLTDWPGPDPAATVHEFDEGGLSVVHKDDWKVIMDHGPLGTPPSYGHGHADALALCVYYNQQEIFCDNGTGSYGGDSTMRQYFRGTAAHNCVQPGKLDYARQETAFMWSKPYRCCRLKTAVSTTQLEIWAVLDDIQLGGCQLWRYVQVASNSVVIVDKAVTPIDTSLNLRWHIAQEVKSLEQQTWQIGRSAKTLALQVSGGMPVQIQNDASNFAGTRSKYYGITEPVNTLLVQQISTGENYFVTVLNRQAGTLSDAEFRQLQLRANEYF